MISFGCKNGQKIISQSSSTAQVVTLYREGHSECKISAKCVSKTAAHIAVVNWRLRSSYSNLKKSGRPKKTTER